MLADLIAHDRLPESGLASFIRNFMAVIEFDAHRQGRLVSRAELQAYTTCLATAVMDGLQYFIGNGQPYPRTHNRAPGSHRRPYHPHAARYVRGSSGRAGQYPGGIS